MTNLEEVPDRVKLAADIAKIAVPLSDEGEH